MTGELKPMPCWHCETSDTITTELDEATGHKWGYAACSCGARGPDVRTGYDAGSQAAWRVEAITAWNTRPREEALEAALRPFLALARAVTVDGSPDFVHWAREAKDWTVAFSFAGHSISLGDLRALAALSHPKGADDGC